MAPETFRRDPIPIPIAMPFPVDIHAPGVNAIPS
jgi:hypothetical protein